jgi:hypothetical protein
MTGLKNLDDEIIRIVNDQPQQQQPLIGLVSSLYPGSTVADISIDSLGLNFTYVPIIQSPYTDSLTSTGGDVMSSTLNLAVGDYVLVIFINGQSSNPIIIGKIPEGEYNG